MAADAPNVSSRPYSRAIEDPLGYTELDEHGMCPHDYAKGLGCHVCDPAMEPKP